MVIRALALSSLSPALSFSLFCSKKFQLFICATVG